MKTIVKLSLAVAVLLASVAGATAADEMTVSGSVMCAKCTLKKPDATKCQDVLVVKNGDQTTEYYIERNEVAKTFGHVCHDARAAVVTGTVTEKDGKKWISPSKMEEPKS
jgi:hypothetical protein